MTIRTPTLLNIPQEIRNKIVELVTSEYANRTRIILRNKVGTGPFDEDEDVCVSFCGCRLNMVCKQLYTEVRPLISSTISWSLNDFCLPNEIPPDQRCPYQGRFYVDHTKSIEVNSELGLDLPVSYFTSKENFRIRGLGAEADKLSFTLSDDPAETRRRFEACISVADESFLGRARKLLLERTWLSALVGIPDRAFRVYYTVEVVSQNRYTLVSLSHLTVGSVLKSNPFVHRPLHTMWKLSIL